MSSQAIEALYATGHWLLSSARHSEAADVFRVMTIAKPDDERGWLALGACHEGIGQRALAAELYRVSSAAAAPAPRCAIARGRALRTISSTQSGDAFDEAYELALAANDSELAALALAEKAAS